MKPRRGLALFDQGVGEPADQVGILGMDHRHRAMAAGQRQQLHDLLVVELHVVIGHVDLERGVALADQARQVGLQHLGRVADDQVEGVVDHSLALRAAVVVVDRVLHRFAPELAGKGDHGGGAAKRSGDRAGVEVVGTHGAITRGLVEVAMTVHTTGQH
jgi:hypothetical protein